MQNNPLISIVVPVYNVEKYLKKCIQSIINQTYKNLEIILVDDGSSDNSGKICDEFAQKDNRIKVIHKTNGGLSDARNAGLDIMSGEWVSFVDSDDFVSKYYIENLYNLATEFMADVSMVSYSKIYTTDFISDYEAFNKPRKFTAFSCIEKLFYCKLCGIGAWGKLYKSQLFENIRFPIGRISEDVGTIPYVLDKANSIAYCDIKDYFYLMRDNSITNESKFNKKYLTVFENFIELKKYFNKNLNIIKAINFYENLVNLAAAVRFGDDYKPYKKPLKFKDFIETLFNKNVKFAHKIYFLLYFCFGYKNCARIWKFHKKSRK